jgi:hypothetical protein
MKNETMEKKPGLTKNKPANPEMKLLMGSISNKYPVVLSDGRTVIFISDKSKEAETRLKYESQKNEVYPSRNSKLNTRS